MKFTIKKLFTCFLAILLVTTTILPNSKFISAKGTDVPGLRFKTLKIKESESGREVADLLKGENPSLKAGVTYAFDVEYSIPSNLQFSNTYFNLKLGDGLYFKTLPGATFTVGHIESTGFEELVKTPAGTGTAPYGYPGVSSEKSKNGDIVYKTKNSLTSVASKGEICFILDEAYLNQDVNQILSNLIQVSLSTDSDKNIDAKAFNVKSEESFTYKFYTNQATEVISKGGTTKSINVYNTGGKSLTEANSKTTVEIVYPSDVELIALEEKGLYNKNGTILSTVENAGLKTTKVEWDENGSYSGGLSFFPHLKVAADSTRPNGSTFDVTIKNFKKTIWNDMPNVGRTSLNSEAKMTVTIIEGLDSENLTLHALVDSASNWALKKYDTYNVRLGSFLIKNEFSTATKKKTLELSIDETDTAIIRGVTIPYHQDMTYGKIYWTSASGKSGTADPSILVKSSKVSALIKNTDLGLDINDSIKTIKVDIGEIPGGYDGIRPVQDLLETWNPNNKYVYDEYYGWSYFSTGVFGTWKKGTDANVVSTLKFYNTGETPTNKETFKLVGKSTAPKVLNGVGNINKTQILGGDSFKVSGRINDANWDWNPLQEPVLYMIMPEGFSYSNLNITNGTLSQPTYVGEFEKDGIKVKVWKYTVDVGEETRGQYQPDFTSKNMNVTFDVKTTKSSKVGTYHINDFLGFTTKDFADIGAVIKAEKWDRSNWNTSKYTTAFGDKVNSGRDMVSLSERPGISVQQAFEITAQSELLIPKTGDSFIYDSTSEDTKTATTPILANNDEAIMRINVRNNTTNSIGHSTLFIPLFNENLDFGPGFMPEGKNKLPLKFEKVESTSNFEIKYLKIKDNKKFNLNESPKVGDYDEVTDPSEANMLMLVSKSTLAAGDGGRIDVHYKVDGNLTATYNNGKNVITPVLDYDINGNKSTLTKEPAAVSFFRNAPETINILVSKKWVDANGDELQAPIEKVEVELFQNGTSLLKKEVSSTDNWRVSFENLIKVNTETGEDYEYTIKETGLDNKNQVKIGDSWYSSKVTGNSNDGFTISNEKVQGWTPLIPATTKVTVTKEWKGISNENLGNVSVTVKLYKNGEDTNQTKVLNKDNGFKATFENLKDTDSITAGGVKNVYTIKEVNTSGDVLDEGQKIELNGKEFTVHYDGFKITNTLVNPKISVSGEKIWNDENNQDGIRPYEVTIHLFANGVDSGKITKATKDSDWKYIFENLDTFDANGKVIDYTVKEDVPERYTSKVEGTKITNTHSPELINISVEKKWVDDNNLNNVRPNEVIIHLFANDEEVGEYKLLSNEDWKHTFKNLAKYKDGTEIKYSIKEETVENYSTSYSGDYNTKLVVTNTYIVPNNPENPNRPQTPSKEETPKKGKVLPRTNIATNSIVVPILGAILSGFAFRKNKKYRKNK